MADISTVTLLDNNTYNLRDAGAERSSNKVTTLSSTSTDNEYPSAKCAYDILCNIETALQNIYTYTATDANSNGHVIITGPQFVVNST